MAQIELRNLSKHYGKSKMPGPRLPFFSYTEPEYSRTPQINNLSLSLDDGKTTVILGPSGCGKTTLLRMIAGLMQADSGEITYNGVPLPTIPMKERKIGMVFQNYALYPHMETESNILTWFLFRNRNELKNREGLKEELLKKTTMLLEVSLEHLFGKLPKQLSGGEKQRVAVARCITREPALFLMDEPFSNLDQILRQKYRANLKRILQEFSITTVFVTHDQQEALMLADRIALMKDGRIEQVGTFEELYKNPDTLFVASFLNPVYSVPQINTLPAEKLFPSNKGLTVGIRPQNFIIEPSQKKGTFPASVLTQTHNPLSEESVITLDLAGETVTAIGKTDKTYKKGETLPIAIRDYLLFNSESGNRVREQEAQ